MRSPTHWRIAPRRGTASGRCAWRAPPGCDASAFLSRWREPRSRWQRRQRYKSATGRRTERPNAADASQTVHQRREDTRSSLLPAAIGCARNLYPAERSLAWSLSRMGKRQSRSVGDHKVPLRGQGVIDPGLVRTIGEYSFVSINVENLDTIDAGGQIGAVGGQRHIRAILIALQGQVVAIDGGRGEDKPAIVFREK